MTTLLLVRHGAFDGVGARITGRLPGVHLNEEGRAQVHRLGEHFRGTPVAAIYASPLERTQETAAAISSTTGIPVTTLDALLEIDYGAWTGCTVDDLRGDQRWRDWNHHRATTRIPGGEMMLEVQTRTVVALEDVCARHDGGTIVAVSHGDVIRSVLAFYAGMTLNDLLRIQVDPASISTIEMSGAARTVVQTNSAAGGGRR